MRASNALVYFFLGIPSQTDLNKRTEEAAQTMAEPVCSHAPVHHNILESAVKWTGVIQITVLMVEHV